MQSRRAAKHAQQRRRRLPILRATRIFPCERLHLTSTPLMKHQLHCITLSRMVFTSSLSPSSVTGSSGAMSISERDRERRNGATNREGEPCRLLHIATQCKGEREATENSADGNKEGKHHAPLARTALRHAAAHRWRKRVPCDLREGKGREGDERWRGRAGEGESRREKKAYPAARRTSRRTPNPTPENIIRTTGGSALR